MRAALLVLCAVMAALFAASPVAAELVAKREGAVRIATFNIHLARGKAGKLIAELRGGKSAQVDALAEILQRVRPDIILLQELDWDRSGTALALFEAELARGRRGLKGLSYGYRLQPPVNTGERSGLDLDRDGKRYGPGDAYGWGLFPGQFGFVILSRFPIEVDAARTFRLLRWAETPMARLRPKRPDGGWFHPDAIWASMRLSSKTHLDAPIRLPSGQTLHLLASHPTPPVFDGPEDRNGRRAAAEILFWKHYLAGADWIRDDQGRTGGLKKDALFVIAGDQNTDPADGDGRHDAIAALLRDPRIADPAPKSAGAVAASKAQGGVNAKHRGDPALDTADWRDKGRKHTPPGNLRVDYVLPSARLEVVASGVFWPAPDDPLRRLVGDGKPIVSSDHRLVWVDVAAKSAAAKSTDASKTPE